MFSVWIIIIMAYTRQFEMASVKLAISAWWSFELSFIQIYLSSIIHLNYKEKKKRFSNDFVWLMNIKKYYDVGFKRCLKVL